jgi:hypothetical protein
LARGYLPIVHTSVNNGRAQSGLPRYIDKVGTKRQGERFASGKRLNASRCHSAILISLQTGTELGQKVGKRLQIHESLSQSGNGCLRPMRYTQPDKDYPNMGLDGRFGDLERIRYLSIALALDD